MYENYSKAQIKANNKYVKNHYDRFSLVMPKGQKAELQAIAAARGLSLNELIKSAIAEYLAKEIE